MIRVLQAGDFHLDSSFSALTPEQAYIYVGSRLYNKAKQIMDEFMENVRWAYDSSLDRRARV